MRLRHLARRRAVWQGLGSGSAAGDDLRGRVRLARDRHDPPLLWDASQGLYAAILERDARSRYEILNRAGGQDLVRTRERQDSCGDVNRDPAHVVADQLDLPDMEASADLDIEFPYGLVQALSASHGTRGPVERRQKPVTRGLNLATAEVPEAGTDDGVVLA